MYFRIVSRAAFVSAGCDCDRSWCNEVVGAFASAGWILRFVASVFALIYRAVGVGGIRGDLQVLPNRLARGRGDMCGRGICWLGGALALVLAAWSGSATDAEKRQRSMWALLGGTVFRMLLPLAGGLMLDRGVPALAGTGVFEQVLIFYLLTLAVETWLSLGLLGAAKRTS